MSAPAFTLDRTSTVELFSSRFRILVDPDNRVRVYHHATRVERGEYVSAGVNGAIAWTDDTCYNPRLGLLSFPRVPWWSKGPPDDWVEEVVVCLHRGLASYFAASKPSASKDC